MAIRDWYGGYRDALVRLLPKRETIVNARKRASWVMQRIVAGALPEIGKIAGGAATAAAIKWILD